MTAPTQPRRIRSAGTTWLSWATKASMSEASPCMTASCSIGTGPVGLGHLVGQVLQRAAPGPLLGLLFDGAGDHLDDRLDRQHGAEQGGGASDAAALLQVFQGVEGGVDPETGRHRLDRVRHLVE